MAIFASGDYQVGKMRCVPFPKSVNLYAEGKEKGSPTSVEIKLTGPKGSKYVTVVSSMGIAKIDRANKKPISCLVAPYWLVRRVQDKSMANMLKTTMTCTLTTQAGDEAATQRVTVLIMHNIKPVKGGEELLFHEEPLVPKSIMPAQHMAQVTKKRPAAAAPKSQTIQKRR